MFKPEYESRNPEIPIDTSRSSTDYTPYKKHMLGFEFFENNLYYLKFGRILSASSGISQTTFSRAFSCSSWDMSQIT